MEEKNDNPMMTTAEQRLVNLTARVDQLEMSQRASSRIMTVMWLAVSIIAAIVLVKYRHDVIPSGV